MNLDGTPDGQVRHRKIGANPEPPEGAVPRLRRGSYMTVCGSDKA